MSLFKNSVGRPSNETLKRRRIIYSVVAVVVLLLIAGGTYFVINGFSFSTIESTDKNAAKNNLSTPKLSIKELVIMPSGAQKFSLSVDKLSSGEKLQFYKWDEKANAYKSIDLNGSGKTRTVSVPFGEIQWYKVRLYKKKNGKNVYSAYSNTVECNNRIEIPKFSTKKSDLKKWYGKEKTPYYGYDWTIKVNNMPKGTWLEYLWKESKTSKYQMGAKSGNTMEFRVPRGETYFLKARICKGSSMQKFCGKYSSEISLVGK